MYNMLTCQHSVMSETVQNHTQVNQLINQSISAIKPPGNWVVVVTGSFLVHRIVMYCIYLDRATVDMDDNIYQLVLTKQFLFSLYIKNFKQADIQN